VDHGLHDGGQASANRGGTDTRPQANTWVSFSAAVAVAALGIGGTIPAVAQTQQQLEWCNGKNNATPDQQINGCAALIGSGKYSGRESRVQNSER
jgi:hypothetical protein